MHTDAFHTSLALIDHLALLVPRIALHDRKLARALRSSATAIPVHLAAGQPERLARAHAAAGRVHVMLIVAQSWAYVPADDLADAQALGQESEAGPGAVTTMDTASRLEKLTAPA